MPQNIVPQLAYGYPSLWRFAAGMERCLCCEAIECHPNKRWDAGDIRAPGQDLGMGVDGGNNSES
jgi:hypothetical protein